jgi:hypothetical protein
VTPTAVLVVVVSVSVVSANEDNVTLVVATVVGSIVVEPLVVSTVVVSTVVGPLVVSAVVASTVVLSGVSPCTLKLNKHLTYIINKQFIHNLKRTKIGLPMLVDW